MDVNCPGPQEDLASNWQPARSLGADANCPGPQEDLVSNWEPARSLGADAVSGAEFVLAFWLWLPPACLPASGRGWASPD